MMSSTYPFTTGLITGASSGIGYALAVEMARAGVRLAITARRKTELEALAAKIRGFAGEALVLPADLAQPAEAFRIVAEAEQALGRLDLVVANAGMGRTGFLVNAPWETIEQTMMVNTVGAMALVRAALPGMIRQQFGYIVGISSLASYRGMPTAAAYSASKAALSTFLESVRVETRRHGVSVIDVHPGYVRTPMTAVNKHPMPLLMDVDQAARLILKAILRRKAIYDFPWPAGLFMRFVRLLPPALYDRLVGRSRVG